MSSEERTGWDDVDWETYEKISAGLHALDNEDVEVEHEYDYELNSGGSKEVDVVVWDHSRRYTTTTLIECKFYSEPVEQEIIDSLIGVLDHSDANRGVVIAKSGFQQGAIDRAEGSGVELWTLRQIEPEIDLQDRIQRVRMNIEMTVPQLEVMDIDLHATDEENEGRELEVSFDQRNSMIYTTDREPTGETLLDWLNEKQNFAEEGEHTDEFEDALMLVDGDFYMLNSVTYRIERPSNQTEHTYDMLDHVDLLFKNELSGTQEYISLEEALQAFIRNVE